MSLFFGIQCQARARAESGALDLSNAMQMQRQNHGKLGHFGHREGKDS